ncbi:hypothetical protein ACFCP7_18510 [Paenibacillus elgii]
MTNGAGNGASLFSKCFQGIHDQRHEGKVQHALMVSIENKVFIRK